VTVYQVNHATARTGKAYTLAWETPEGRKTKKFADPDEAIAEGRLQASKIAAGRADAAGMSRADFEELQAARHVVGAVPLLSALAEWKRARELTNGQLITAAEAWAARSGDAYEQVTVREAKNQFIAEKIRRGIDVKASYEKILPHFVTKFGERTFATLSKTEIVAWLEERFPRPITHNTARQRVVTLSRWARKNKMLPRGVETEAEQTETKRVSETEVGIITADVFAQLLHYFRAQFPHYLAPLAIAGFCGLRRSEIHGQKWENINLESLQLRVTTAKKRTPANRLVPIAPAAVEWLKLCPNRTGPLCTNAAIDRIREIARAAKTDDGKSRFVPLPGNAFRHSCISHRVAQTGDIAATSLEMGNSVKKIHQSYRAPLSQADGAGWFEIRPASSNPVP